MDAAVIVFNKEGSADVFNLFLDIALVVALVMRN
jgi:hypothetical protein